MKFMQRACFSETLALLTAILGFVGVTACCAVAPEAARTVSIVTDPSPGRAAKHGIGKLAEATAVVSVGTVVGHDIVTVADLAGIRIPKDLSVVGSATRLRHHDPPGFFTRFDYNQEAALASCFDLIEEQMATRQCRFSRILVRPLLIEGDTLAPPRRARAMAL